VRDTAEGLTPPLAKESPMYHAFALVQAGSDLTLAAVDAKLKARFPNWSVATAAKQITITSGDWEYYLAAQSGPEVLQESENIAGRLAGLDADSPLRVCDRRLEVWSDNPDPFMKHFDDHFQILEVLRTFRGVILVDPKEPALL